MTVPAPASVDVDELEKTVEEGLYADWRSPRKKAAGAALDALAARLREAERERDCPRIAAQLRMDLAEVDGERRGWKECAEDQELRAEAAEARVRELEEALRLALPYAESALMQSANRGWAKPAQDVLDKLNRALLGSGEGQEPA